MMITVVTVCAQVVNQENIRLLSSTDRHHVNAAQVHKIHPRCPMDARPPGPISFISYSFGGKWSK